MPNTSGQEDTYRHMVEFFGLPDTALGIQPKPVPGAKTRVNVSGAARNIFLQLTNTTNASANGSFKWIVAYKQFA